MIQKRIFKKVLFDIKILGQVTAHPLTKVNMWVKCEPDLDQEERKYEPHNDVAHNSAMTLSLGQGYCKHGGV